VNDRLEDACAAAEKAIGEFLQSKQFQQQTIHS
jgi:hypothetical protein